MAESGFKKQQPYSILVRNSSYLTDLFPSSGVLIDSFVNSLARNKILNSIIQSNLNAAMNSVETLERVLVVSDLNIGDAVITQAVISGIRDFLPNSMIDYIITKSAADLIRGNNEVSNLFPVFTGRPFPNVNDFIELKRILAANKYDLAINFCPMFSRKKDFFDVNTIHGYYSIGPEVVRNGASPTEINHVIFRSNQFVHNLLSKKLNRERVDSYKGISVFISDPAAAKSDLFMNGIRLKYPENPVIYYNPDGSSQYTKIPLAFQVEIISKLLENDFNILLGCGYSFVNIEKLILSSVPASLSGNIVLVPFSTSLDEMASIVDKCDIYIGGDTGPLHIAAAKKMSSSGKYSFRNQTAIFSIFGATPMRIYGYDSQKPGFLSANQNAESRTFESKSPSRNITCIDKKNKVCRNIKCFESLDTDEIVSEVIHSGLILKL